jgi:hypothetical protein
MDAETAPGKSESPPLPRTLSRETTWERAAAAWVDREKLGRRPDEGPCRPYFKQRSTGALRRAAYISW